MPFAGYRDFEECERQNRQARDPAAYCGSIKSQTEKAVDSASYLHQSVRAAVIAAAQAPGTHYGRTLPGEGVSKPKPKPKAKPLHYGKDVPSGAKPAMHLQKGHDPVKEAGKKKLTAKDGVAHEGAQDDQAFAVAFGPDNYDKLTKAIIAAPYQEAYNAAGIVLKALENKQFNFPGNIEEHMKKAHAAIHGREMWDARYGDVCDLITQARKILHSIEKTAEVSQGGSGMMVVGKADPVSKHKDKQGSTAHHEQPAFSHGAQKKPEPHTHSFAEHPTSHTHPGQEKWPTRRPEKPYLRPRSKAKKARGDMGVSGAGGVAKPGWAQTKQSIPGGGSRGDYRNMPKKPEPTARRPKPTVGHGNLPPSGNPHRGYAHKAVQKAIKAVRGR